MFCFHNCFSINILCNNVWLYFIIISASDLIFKSGFLTWLLNLFLTIVLQTMVHDLKLMMKPPAVQVCFSPSTIVWNASNLKGWSYWLVMASDCIHAFFTCRPFVLTCSSVEGFQVFAIHDLMYTITCVCINSLSVYWHLNHDTILLYVEREGILFDRKCIIRIFIRNLYWSLALISITENAS